MKKIQLFFLISFRYLSKYASRLIFLIRSLRHLSPTHRQKIKHRKIFPKFTQSQQKYLIICALLGLALVLTLRFGKAFLPQNTLSEGIIGIYTTHNLPTTVTNLLSDPLVSIDKSGNPKPKLAASWQANKDATVYTFTLRDNLYWNDGSKLKASDIKFSLPDIEVSYPDDKTIEFKLADAFNPFPSLLTAPVFKNNSLIGVGQFKVKQVVFSRDLITKISLIPAALENPTQLPTMVIRFYPDESTIKTAFEMGEVDSLISYPQAEEWASLESVKVKQITNFNKLVAVFYNTKDPSLADKNFRKALSYASPKIEKEEVAKTSIQPNSWAFNNEVKGHLNDLEQAKNYLAKVPNGKQTPVILTTTPFFSSVGEKIVAAWKQLGLNASLRVESGIPQNFQALLLPQSIPSDPDQYSLWHSTQVNTNLSKYSSPRIDKDLEDGRKVADLDKRIENYLDFQKVLLDDNPATFLYFSKNNIIYRQKVEQNLNQVLPMQVLF